MGTSLIMITMRHGVLSETDETALRGLDDLTEKLKSPLMILTYRTSFKIRASHYGPVIKLVLRSTVLIPTIMLRYNFSNNVKPK